MFAQNIDCEPRRVGSNEYPQSMFWNSKKNRFTHVNPIFLYKSGE